MPFVTARRLLPLAALLLACHPRMPASSLNPTAERAPNPFGEQEVRALKPIEMPDRTVAPVLIRNATVLTATGQRFSPGYVLLSGGRIEAVGAGDRTAPEGARVIDATGRFVTPGLIDAHSHLGLYPSPSTSAHNDGNEMTDPVTAGLHAEHSIWPQDPGLERAIAGGVTTAAILPGSANLIGGRGVIVHLVPHRGARAMRLEGAPEILKMACGENPKRLYGDQKRAPATRMASVRNTREAFVKAEKYKREWEEYLSKQKKDAPAEPVSSPPRRPPVEGDINPAALDKPTTGEAPASGGLFARKNRKGEGDKERKPPDRDLALETLAQVLSGHILVQWHCYQADDMLSALQIADEFGFKVRTFHHALEAYKIRDILASRQVAVATWADRYGFKMEALDGLPWSIALLEEAGGRPVVHSDSAVTIQILNQEAAKAMSAGQAAGIPVTEEHALRWLTMNPAWALGIDDQVGSLEPGKRADVVVWTGSPFSIYSRASQVFVDGRLVFDLSAPGQPWSDFELGYRSTATPAGQEERP